MLFDERNPTARLHALRQDWTLTSWPSTDRGQKGDTTTSIALCHRLAGADHSLPKTKNPNVVYRPRPRSKPPYLKTCPKATIELLEEIILQSGFDFSAYCRADLRVQREQEPAVCSPVAS